jgi:hypothetical protein
MYKLNSKNLAVKKLLPKGKDSPRLKYIHASPKGTAVIQPSYLCRVSLPEHDQLLGDPIHISGPSYIQPVGKEDWIEGKTSPEYLVPNIEMLIPNPNEQVFTITLDGDILERLLKVANEVNEEPLNTLRLRWCPDRGMLRIDTYAEKGEQTFLGLMRTINYSGHIPGDVIKGHAKPKEKPVQLLTTLKSSEGRRFRSE